jgi:hypothetical protein
VKGRSGLAHICVAEAARPVPSGTDILPASGLLGRISTQTGKSTLLYHSGFGTTVLYHEAHT